MNRALFTVGTVAIGVLATVGAVAVAALRKVDNHVGIGDINDSWGSFNSDIFDENPKGQNVNSKPSVKPNTFMTPSVGSIRNAPVEQSAPAKRVPAKKAPAKKAPAKRVPAKKAPAKRAPAKRVPVKRTPAK